MICGLGGADVLVGRGADDVLVGGPGADYFVPGAGRDRVLGGLGNDFVLARDGKTRHRLRRLRLRPRAGSTGGSTSRSRATRDPVATRRASSSRAASSITAVAVAADQLERLRTGGLAELDPDVAALLAREAERQRTRSS